jgi:hypothetical protein
MLIRPTARCVVHDATHSPASHAHTTWRTPGPGRTVQGATRTVMRIAVLESTPHHMPLLKR